MKFTLECSTKDIKEFISLLKAESVVDNQEKEDKEDKQEVS